MLVYSCAELFQQQDKRGGVRGMKEPLPLDFGSYTRLHGEGKSLISGWLNRAWTRWLNRKEELFEPFIYTWFAFNSWAACVSDTDRDADIIDSLAADRRMNETFESLTNEQDSPVAINAKAFFDLLPIFDAKTLNRSHLLRFDDGDSRAVRVAFYFSQGIDVFEPKCWTRHVKAGESLPMDWAHILKAIYKVRCNLFHGQKMAHSEMNRRIVSAAFLTLAHFITEAGYIQINSRLRTQLHHGTERK